MHETRASRALKVWIEEIDEAGERKRTQEGVAKAISERLGRETAINQSSVSAWCAGRSQPRTNVAVVLSELAGIELGWWTESAEHSAA